MASDRLSLSTPDIAYDMLLMALAVAVPLSSVKGSSATFIFIDGELGA